MTNIKHLLQQAKCADISLEELWKRKAELKIAWENGDGWEGARARLKCAEDFFRKWKNRGVGATGLR